MDLFGKVLWSENLGLFRHSANNSLDNRTTNYEAVLLPEETDVKSEEEDARSGASSRRTEATTPLLANNETDETSTAERAHANDDVLQDILTDPLSSIKEVVSPDTVILDQVHGASIHWDNLDPEPYFDNGSNSLCGLFFHLAACWCLLTPVYTAFCIYHKVFHGHDMRHQPQWLAWLIFISVPVTAAIALLAPVVLLATRTRARPPFKSRLIGIEGVVDAAALEKYLWGFDHGNPTETTAQSYRGAHDMQQESVETRRDFTLLDTHLMTVTHFRNHVPPTAMFVVGEEAGKQRALLCSYNHRTETFHREEILKSNPRSLEEMLQVSGVRLSLSPRPKAGEIQTLTRFNRSSRWAIEILFFAICIIGYSVRIVETFRHHDFYSLLSHKFSIVSGYIPAVAAILYLDRPLEAMPYALVLKMSLGLMYIAYERLHRSLGAIYGIMNGSLSLLLVTAILSWYSLEEMVLRILLWAVVVPRLFELLMLFQLAFGLLGIEIVLIGITLSAFMLATFTRSRGGFSVSGIIGTPQDVAWLPSDQKVQISQEAAMGKFVTLQNVGDLWPARKVAPSPLLTFHCLFHVCIAPCVILSALHLRQYPEYASLANFALALWTIIIHEAATWPEAVITIDLTFAGGVLGQLIFASKDAMTQKPWGSWAYFSLFLIQTAIWAVLWTYGWMGSRREKTLGRTVALEDMCDQETGRQQQEYRTYYGAFDRA